MMVNLNKPLTKPLLLFSMVETAVGHQTLLN